MAKLEIWWRQLATDGPRGGLQRLALWGLIPLGWLWGAVQSLRAWLYAQGILPSYRSPAPVVAVGNLALGGTGKTPLVEQLLTTAKALGFSPAVVSRGYGRRHADAVVTVCAGQGPLLSAQMAGDELLWLAQQHPDAVVVASARRHRGIQQAVSLGATLILLDDAFQHLAVQRDLNLLLLDAAKPFGNGRLFPAGLLRESPRAIRRATHVLLTRATGDEANHPVPHAGRCRYQLAPTAHSLEGQQCTLAALSQLRLGAFAGIANPRQFFDQAQAAGLPLEKSLALPDHVAYDAASLNSLEKFCTGLDALITTEKDGVKLSAGALPIPCWPLRLEVQVEPEHLLPQLLAPLVSGRAAMTPNKELLELLVCPACHGPLRTLTSPTAGLACDRCRLLFPLVDGIPVMLVDDAIALGAETGQNS